MGCFPGGASPYGVQDLAGNVWEWTRTLWGTDPEKAEYEYPYDPEDGRENLSAGDDVHRVLRGGSFVDLEGSVRCACRGGGYPGSFGRRVGFRVVVAPE